MSRIGRKPIVIPEGVAVDISNRQVAVSGPKGQLDLTLLPRIEATISADHIAVTRRGNDPEARAFHGLIRQLIANAVTGVCQGFTKRLEMHGIGYRAQTDGQKLTLNVGFTHPVIVEAPSGVTFAVEKNTLITVSGYDKQQVGQAAADVRAIKKPEPYKGKGIRYVGEHVRRKAGKAAKAGK